MRVEREVGVLAVGSKASSSALGKMWKIVNNAEESVVWCGGRARFDVPVPCPACRTVVNLCLGLGIDFFSVKHPPCQKRIFFYVDAVFQLGRSSIPKNVYERFLFSLFPHSPPSLKAASPADCA